MTTLTCMHPIASRTTSRTASHRWLRMASLLLLACGLWGLAQPAHAMNLAIGEGKLLTVRQGTVGTVSLADPTIADVQVPSPTTLLVIGKRSGSTTLYALDSDGKVLLERHLVVTHNLSEIQSVL